MTPAPRKWTRLFWLACDIGISPATFFLSQAVGVGTVRALVFATVVAAIWFALSMIRRRQLDGLSLTMLATYAVMLAMALTIHDPRLMLLRDPVVSAIAGLLFLVSCLTALPATADLAERFHGTAPTPELLPVYRVSSLVWGIALTAEAAGRAALVFVLPISMTVAFSSVAELVIVAMLIAWTMWYRKRRSVAKSFSEELISSPPMPSRSDYFANAK
ncbi:VC0807 family protein [Nocardia sp. NPDC051030]|uniref:VC0807 family protein n=1 Tax=Nocardia sp. NPDC051030 TaxID=3155162 RepID=UPI0034382158